MAVETEREIKMADFYVCFVLKHRNCSCSGARHKEQAYFPLCVPPLTFAFCSLASLSVHMFHVTLSLCTKPINSTVFTTLANTCISTA
jgi:hypothetical protein